jgi:putative phosphoesterase
MKIVVISDTHMPVPDNKLPEALIKELKDCELLIHAGDLTELSVLDVLKKLVHTEAVVGNMDSHKVRRALPEKKILQLGKFRFGIIHGYGSPRNLINYIQEKFKGEKLDCVIYGHSHTPSIDKVGDTIYFNPGSLTDKVFAPYNSFGIIEIGNEIAPKIIRL